MLLARCYNNEGLETEIAIGQYIDVEIIHDTYYGVGVSYYYVRKRSTGEYLFNMLKKDFEKCFEIINN